MIELASSALSTERPILRRWRDPIANPSSFDYPNMPEGHSLRRHLLYWLKREENKP